jgi:hypothetical protein
MSWPSTVSTWWSADTTTRMTSRATSTWPMAGQGSRTTNGLFSSGSGSRDDGDLPLLMAYGRKSGYGSYGPGAINRGSRVIEFHTFTSVEEEQLQTQQIANSLQPSTYYSLPPQFMHGGSFKWMETWITDYKGVREPITRPIYKYQVQEMCYSAAQGIRSVYATVLILAFVLVGAELF